MLTKQFSCANIVEVAGEIDEEVEIDKETDNTIVNRRFEEVGYIHRKIYFYRIQ